MIVLSTDDTKLIFLKKSLPCSSEQFATSHCVLSIVFYSTQIPHLAVQIICNARLASQGQYHKMRFRALPSTSQEDSCKISTIYELPLQGYTLETLSHKTSDSTNMKLHRRTSSSLVSISFCKMNSENFE